MYFLHENSFLVVWNLSQRCSLVLYYEIIFSGIFCQENWCLPVYVWIPQQEAAQQPDTRWAPVDDVTDVCSLSDSISLFIIPLSIFLTKIITSTNNPLLCFTYLWQKFFYAIFSWWEVIETIHCCKLLISLTFYLETFRMKFKSHVIFASKSVFCTGKVFFD